MIKKTLLLITLTIVLFSLLSCETTKGLKEDATFIGEKTTEFLDTND